MADERPIITYSKILGEDDAFKKAKAEIEDFEKFVTGKAEKIKGSLSLVDTKDTKAVSDLAKQVDILKQSKLEAEKATLALLKAEKLVNQEVKEAIKQEILLEKAKQEKTNTTKKEIQAEAELNKAIITENNVKKSNIAVSEAERRQREAAEKGILKEKDAYGRLSAELNLLFRASANLASEMFILEQAGRKATPEYQKLELEFNDLSKKTINLDQNLKKIDATLGRNQRNVGNYAGSFNGLQNSVNQITRELPAFTFSMQTGFLAMSNNIPILVDEVNRLKSANRELAASGKPVKSILGELGGALFSWNTLISLGITLITVYGKEIANWVTNMKGAKNTLEEMYNAQFKFDKARAAGKAQFTNELEFYQKYKAIATDINLPLVEREIAFKRLRELSDYYLKNLTDQQLGSANLTKLEYEYTKAIEKRAAFQNKLKEVEGTAQRIEELQAELDARQKYASERLKLERSINDSDKEAAIREFKNKEQKEAFIVTTKAEIKALDIAEKQRKKRRDNLDDEILSETNGNIIKANLNALTKEYALQLKYANKYHKEQILLEYKEEKNNEKKVKSLRAQQINNVDYLASDFEFRRTLLEGNIATNEEIFNSDEYSLSRRLLAQKDLVKESLALAELERKEAIRILTNKYNEEKNETIKDSDGKILGKKYTANGLIELEKQYRYDLLTIQEQWSQKEADAQKKGNQIALIDTLQMQIDNLKFTQKFLSKKSDLYKQYTYEISLLQHEINKITREDDLTNMSDRLKISEMELARLKKLNKDIAGERKIETPLSFLTGGQYKVALKKIEQFEKDKAKIEKENELIKSQNRIAQINTELKQYGDQTLEYKTLMEERTKIESDLEKKKTEETLNRQKEIFEKWKQFTEELNGLISTVLDKVIELTQKRVEQENIALENQRVSVETQERRAEQGLDNTLAFEQKAMAERELRLQKQMKREERLQKIKSVWTSYSGYVEKEKEPGMALAKTLRDFAILEAITASFGDGGLVADKVPTDGKGIIRGRAHSGNGGGIPVMVEREEGFLSRRDMANFGKENFYALKSMLGRGKMSADMFKNQKTEFISAMPIMVDNTNIERALVEVKTEIRNKPVSTVNVQEMANGMLKLIETTQTPNKTKRDIYIIKKPRV